MELRKAKRKKKREGASCVNGLCQLKGLAQEKGISCRCRTANTVSSNHLRWGAAGTMVVPYGSLTRNNRETHTFDRRLFARTLSYTSCAHNDLSGDFLQKKGHVLGYASEQVGMHNLQEDEHQLYRDTNNTRPLACQYDSYSINYKYWAS